MSAHTHILRQLPASLGILLMETWTAVVSADQGHVVVGILQRLSSMELPPCRSQNQTMLPVGGGNKQAGKRAQGGQNNRMLKFVITSPASCNNRSSPNSLPVSHAARSTSGRRGDVAVPLFT